MEDVDFRIFCWQTLYMRANQMDKSPIYGGVSLIITWNLYIQYALANQIKTTEKIFVCIES